MRDRYVISTEAEATFMSGLGIEQHHARKLRVEHLNITSRTTVSLNGSTTNQARKLLRRFRTEVGSLDDPKTIAAPARTG